MYRLSAARLMIACLLAPVTAATRERGQTSQPPSNLPELNPLGPEMLTKMREFIAKLVLGQHCPVRNCMRLFCPPHPNPLPPKRGERE
jgi:hypothetical protein